MGQKKSKEKSKKMEDGAGFRRMKIIRIWRGSARSIAFDGFDHKMC